MLDEKWAYYRDKTNVEELERKTVERKAVACVQHFVEVLMMKQKIKNTRK